MLKLNKRKNLKLHTLFKYKEIVDWDVAEVCDWLNSLNLSKCYRDLFYFHEIDGNMIVDFDEDDLIALPIERLSHRKKILQGLANYRPTGSSSSLNALISPRVSKNLKSPRKTPRGKDLMGFQTKEVFRWTVPEAQQWMLSLPLCYSHQYFDAFRFHEIDGKTLLVMEEADLEDLPIHSQKDKKILLHEIQALKLRKNISVSSSSSSSSNLRVKCVCADEIQTIILSNDERFDSFSLKIEEEFGEGYYAKLCDEDGDLVTIRNDDDVWEVLEAAKKRRAKLYIFSRKKKRGNFPKSPRTTDVKKKEEEEPPITKHKKQENQIDDTTPDSGLNECS